MITLERPAYYIVERYAEYCGLSTDNKADIKDPHNGDTFHEMDTSKKYRYNEAGKEWVEQPKDSVAADTDIPAMTSETKGKFLSNDGAVTKWQDIASTDFIVELTDNKDGTYAANKTFVEIKTAFEDNENIAVAIGNSRLPLMNGEIAENGDAGFTFGYTQVTTDGQLLTTRAINYHHTADPASDEWADADQTTDFSQLAHIDSAATKSHVELEKNSAITVNLTDGTYLMTACDERHRGLTCVFVCGSSSTVFDLSGMAGWAVSKNANASNAIYIDNKIDTPLTVYITAIGGGNV